MLKSFIKGSLVSIMLFCVMLPVVSGAYVTYNRHRVTNGVGNYGYNTQYYFIASSANSEASRITNAWYKWNNSNGTGAYTPIWFGRTYSQPNATIDFHATKAKNGTIGGTTYWYNGSRNVAAASTNWYWAKITNWGYYYTGLSAWQKDMVWAHEIGHALGLDHEVNVNRLMNPNGSATKVNGPTRNELDGITSLY